MVMVQCVVTGGMVSLSLVTVSNYITSDRLLQTWDLYL